jgi:hypothetical protein
MVLIAQTMKQHDNDNEPLSFITLAAATANVVRYLQTDKQKNEECEREPAPRRRDEQKRAEQLEYVEKRLRELRAWERKIGGNKN